MRLGILVLTLCCAACEDAGSGHPQVIAADSTREVTDQFSAQELMAYERGRREEIAELRSGARLTPGAIDSIGARAAGLSPEDYRELTQAIDDYLKQRPQMTATQLGAVLVASDSLLGLLDSQRVERLVLGVRAGE